MSEIITRHITEYYDLIGTIPDFNVINITRQGSPTTFERKPNDLVAQCISDLIRYGSSTMTYYLRRYLYRSHRRCI